MRDKLIRILLYFGADNQKKKCIEELSELIQAISKDNNRNNIIEEIADCEIMIEQLKMIWVVDESEIEHWKKEKISKVIMRIK